MPENGLANKENGLANKENGLANKENGLANKENGLANKENGLANKMKLKPNQQAALINAPDGYREELGPLPPGVELSDQLSGRFDWVQVFVKSKIELDALAPQIIAALKPASLLWITFPKGSSKIQTDLTRDKGWDALHGTDLKWTNLISVNETWSAFSLRPYKPGEARQTFR